jgi:hypothetical protein
VKFHPYLFWCGVSLHLKPHIAESGNKAHLRHVKLPRKRLWKMRRRRMTLLDVLFPVSHLELYDTMVKNFHGLQLFSYTQFFGSSCS